MLFSQRPRAKVSFEVLRAQLPLCTEAEAIDAGAKHAERVILLVRNARTRPQGCAEYARNIAEPEALQQVFADRQNCNWTQLDPKLSPVPHALDRLASAAGEAEKLCASLDLEPPADRYGGSALDGLTDEDREALNQFWTGQPPPPSPEPTVELPPPAVQSFDTSNASANSF
jgi:hypothetical protein